MGNIETYLEPTFNMECDNNSIIDKAEILTNGELEVATKAKKLFFWGLFHSFRPPFIPAARLGGKRALRQLYYLLRVLSLSPSLWNTGKGDGQTTGAGEGERPAMLENRFKERPHG